VPSVSGYQLAMIGRLEIEIDYCPSCRGVWLDRGELDKLIERGAASAMPASAQEAAPSRPVFRDSDFGHGSHSKHRRKSWLSDIFD
jgi:Zn-finger nucleic acid-binding protein